MTLSLDVYILVLIGNINALGNVLSIISFFTFFICLLAGLSDTGIKEDARRYGKKAFAVFCIGAAIATVCPGLDDLLKATLLTQGPEKAAELLRLLADAMKLGL